MKLEYKLCCNNEIKIPLGLVTLFRPIGYHNTFEASVYQAAIEERKIYRMARIVVRGIK